MKIKRFILRDKADSFWDDYIVFENYVEKEDIIKRLQELKEENEDYNNEDVYLKLRELGGFSISDIGSLEIIEY